MSSQPASTNPNALGDPRSIQEEGTTHFSPGEARNDDSDQGAPSDKDLGASSITLDNQAQRLESARPEETVTTSTPLNDSEKVVTNKEEDDNLIEDDGEEPTDSDEDDFPQSEDTPRGPLKGQVTGQKPPKPRPK